MKRTLPILLLLLAANPCARGQYLRLAGNPAGTALYFDPGRLWDYNLYEHSRWGGGLRLEIHPQRFIFSQIDAEAYLGYGTFDQQWKYGLALAEHVRGSRCNSVFYQRFEHDYFATGSRRIADPWSAGGQLLGGFMSRRMTEDHSLTLGLRCHTARWRWAAELTWGRQAWLFDENQLLHKDIDTLSYNTFGRLRLVMRHLCGVSAQLEYFSDWHTLRLLADYRHGFTLKPLRLDLYTQGGFTPAQNAYIHMFDLGGTWGAPVYLRNSLLTARPNEFTANTFALISLRLQPDKPLYSVYSQLFHVGSNPLPFVGLTAVWGTMWNQDTDGQRPWLTTHLQAPHRGLLEATLGVDGIIRCGAVDWGAAVAYRIDPHSAPYHRNSVAQNLAFLITATLLQ